MYPQEIMPNVYWGFYGGKYRTLEAFVEEVKRYNEDFGIRWNPDETVFEGAALTVQFAYWDEEDDEETEEDFDLHADKGAFTAGELLFKIHNHVVEKLEDDDRHFFEGLTLWEGEDYANSKTPLYFLNQGS